MAQGKHEIERAQEGRAGGPASQPVRGGRMVRHSGHWKGHQNIDRCCENVLKAALLNYFDEPSPGSLRAQLQAVQAPIVRVVCASPSRPLKPRFSAIIISELAAKPPFSHQLTRARRVFQGEILLFLVLLGCLPNSASRRRLDPPGP